MTYLEHQFSSVAQSCPTLQLHELQHARPPYPSPIQSSLKLTSIESMIPSSHLILCRPLFLLPPILPSLRVFSNESTLRMRWPKFLKENTLRLQWQGLSSNSDIATNWWENRDKFFPFSRLEFPVKWEVISSIHSTNTCWVTTGTVLRSGQDFCSQGAYTVWGVTQIMNKKIN